MRLAYAWLIFMLLRQRSYGSLNCSNSRFMQSLRTLSLFIWNDIRWRWCVCKYYYFHLSCLSPFHILGALFLSRSFFSNCSADSHLIRCRMSDLLTPYLKPLRLNCKGRRVSLCSGDTHEMSEAVEKAWRDAKLLRWLCRDHGYARRTNASMCKQAKPWSFPSPSPLLRPFFREVRWELSL